jgi:hypothetical protein
VTRAVHPTGLAQKTKRKKTKRETVEEVTQEDQVIRLMLKVRSLKRVTNFGILEKRRTNT